LVQKKPKRIQSLCDAFYPSLMHMKRSLAQLDLYMCQTKECISISNNGTAIRIYTFHRHVIDVLTITLSCLRLLAIHLCKLNTYPSLMHMKRSLSHRALISLALFLLCYNQCLTRYVAIESTAMCLTLLMHNSSTSLIMLSIQAMLFFYHHLNGHLWLYLNVLQYSLCFQYGITTRDCYTDALYTPMCDRGIKYVSKSLL